MTLGCLQNVSLAVNERGRFWLGQDQPQSAINNKLIKQQRKILLGEVAMQTVLVEHVAAQVDPL